MGRVLWADRASASSMSAMRTSAGRDNSVYSSAPTGPSPDTVTNGVEGNGVISNRCHPRRRSISSPKKPVAPIGTQNEPWYTSERNVTLGGSTAEGRAGPQAAEEARSPSAPRRRPLRPIPKRRAVSTESAANAPGRTNTPRFQQPPSFARAWRMPRRALRAQLPELSDVPVPETRIPAVRVIREKPCVPLKG